MACPCPPPRPPVRPALLRGAPRSLGFFSRLATWVAPGVALLVLAQPAAAAEVLLVADGTAGADIAAVLAADGHTVTTVTDDYRTGSLALKGALGVYDVVYWIANGSGSGDRHDDAAVFTNLSSYVTSGGRVFVTGYDSVASPADPMLIAFLGAAGATDGPSAPGPVAMVENSLTAGVVDIRGVTPTGAARDLDALTGLAATTVSVVTTGGVASQVQWALRALGSGEIAYVSNGDTSGTHVSWTTTTAGGPGAYNAALRNFAQAAETASADPGAPEIEFDSPTSVEEGGALTVSVSVDDPEGDAFTLSWDLDDDGTFGETPGATSHTIAAGTTDGPMSVRVAVEAVDASGNTARRSRSVRVLNVAPTITSEPPAVTGIGGELRYSVEATDPAGAADPFVYRMIEGPEGAAISAAGLFTWTPGAADVTSGAETVRVELEVSDGDGGLATQLWEMTVVPNMAPEAGGLVFPIGRVVLEDPEPRLVVQNGDDRDLDPLTYFFELDTSETFDSPELRASGPVAELPGLTFWYPGELGQAVYYWRAWVSDGIAETAPQEASFQIYLGEPAGVDAAVGDGGGPDGGAADGGGAVDPGDDGGCSAAGLRLGARRASPWPLALCVAGLGGLCLARRRRRRR